LELPHHPPDTTLVQYMSPLQIESPDAEPKLAGMEALLSKMLPERMWVSKGQFHVQYVSSTPATTADVRKLETRLNKELKRRGAHRIGVCRTRSQLFEQAFDEIIRQVTITCDKRGKLLKRIHSEIRNRIETYETLFQSSNAYGVRSTLRGNSKKEDLRDRIALLERENKELEIQIEQEMAKRANLQAGHKKATLAGKEGHEMHLKASIEEYDGLMKRYTDKVRVSFEEKKKKKGRK